MCELRHLFLLAKRAICFSPANWTTGKGQREPRGNWAESQEGQFSMVNRCGEETAKLAFDLLLLTRYLLSDIFALGALGTD
ncbi:hypothetical protein ES703_33369 [subsurface metagenome]